MKGRDCRPSCCLKHGRRTTMTGSRRRQVGSLLKYSSGSECRKSLRMPMLSVGEETPHGFVRPQPVSFVCECPEDFRRLPACYLDDPSRLRLPAGYTGRGAVVSCLVLVGVPTPVYYLTGSLNQCNSRIRIHLAEAFVNSKPGCALQLFWKTLVWSHLVKCAARGVPR